MSVARSNNNTLSQTSYKQGAVRRGITHCWQLYYQCSKCVKRNLSSVQMLQSIHVARDQKLAA